MSQFISITEAIDMTTLYRANRELILTQSAKNKQILPTCESFSLAVVNQVLTQAGCQGLRVYYGMDPSLKLHAILVGYDSQDRDMLPPLNTEAEDSGGPIVERGTRCPDICPPPSPLNP